MESLGAILWKWCITHFVPKISKIGKRDDESSILVFIWSKYIIISESLLNKGQSLFISWLTEVYYVIYPTHNRIIHLLPLSYLLLLHQPFAWFSTTPRKANLILEFKDLSEDSSCRRLKTSARLSRCFF